MKDVTMSRRSMLAMSAAASLLACTGLERTARAAAGGLTRAIPQTGEHVPAVGLGTFMTFDRLPGTGRGPLQEVLKRFLRAGGRMIDTSPLYGSSETNVGDFLSALDSNELPFITNKVWSTGEFLWDDSHAAQSLHDSQLRLWRERIDLMQCHSLVNVDVVVALLNAWKREGRIRYVGVTHHEPSYFDSLADWIARGEIDFVQVHYSIHTIAAEERVLPAAQEHGVAVLVNMPLEKARLHKLVEGQELPGFARELGIENWSQYFLKWVLAHPAVTAVLPATSNPEHVMENMGALHGPLPDAATRTRMRAHLQAMPGFDTLATQPWYPGKSYPGLVNRGQQAIRARL